VKVAKQPIQWNDQPKTASDYRKIIEKLEAELSELRAAGASHSNGNQSVERLKEIVKRREQEWQEISRQMLEIAADRDAIADKHNNLLFRMGVMSGQVAAINAMSHIAAYAVLESQKALAEGVKVHLPAIQEAVRKLDTHLKEFDRSDDESTREFMEHVHKIVKAAKQASDPDDPHYDGGQYLREIAPEYDDAFPGIIEIISREQQEAEQERQEAEKRKHITHVTAQRQEARDAARQMMIDAGQDRPTWLEDRKWTKLRDYCLAKHDSDPTRKDALDWLRDASRSSLSGLFIHM
jgi:DNA repair exonuclease SbcCD ATPase subunit